MGFPIYQDNPRRLCRLRPQSLLPSLVRGIFEENLLTKPLVLLDVPLLPFMQAQVEPLCEMCPWALLKNGDQETLARIQGMYTYAHPIVDGALA